jgi:hypothetical protein
VVHSLAVAARAAEPAAVQPQAKPARRNTSASTAHANALTAQTLAAAVATLLTAAAPATNAIHFVNSVSKHWNQGVDSEARSSLRSGFFVSNFNYKMAKSFR